MRWSPSLVLLLRQGLLQYFAHDYVQITFEYLPAISMLYNLYSSASSYSAVSMGNMGQCLKKLFPDAQMEPPMFQYLFVF